MNLGKQDIVELAFGEGGLLSQKFAGYKVREQQVELAKMIQESIAQGKPMLGEAPTGVGKSLAALIPSFETIIKEDKPVIVVTSSIILQEQYFYKDIPVLEDLFNYNVGAVLIKGRNNYLCKLKQNEVKAGNFTNHSSHQQKEFMGVKTWAEKTKTGDMNELEFVPSRSTWSNFAAMDQNDCARKECPLFGSCHYYNQRRKMMSSKLVICNYHYFFSAMGTEGMLPEGAKVIIMDEGHEIAAIARDFQERKYNTSYYRNSMNGFAKAYKAVGRSPFAGDAMAFLEELHLDLAQASMNNMLIEMTRYFFKNKRSHLDNLILKVADRKALQTMSLEHYKEIEECLKYISYYLENTGLPQDQRAYWPDVYEKEQITWQAAIENLYGNIHDKKKFLEDFFLIDDGGVDLLSGEIMPSRESTNDASVVYWLETHSDQSVSLNIKPSSGADLTSSLFESGEYVPIVLSATLAVNKEFDHMKKDLGIKSGVNELVVGSPFDLNENLLWYLPMNIPAGNQQNHQTEMLDAMGEVVKLLDGRTLCLFTSNKNLNAGVKHLRRILPSNIQVVAQNELPKPKIIQMMKDNPNTVIAATRSFFTGVDIQGQNLSAVLIDKLPYPMIGDPVNDYLMSDDRGFWTFTLPETVIALKQGFGRLNRTFEDKGIVAIFDGRLSTAGYKARIFNSFDFEVSATRDWDVVKAYVNNINLD